MMRIFLDRLYLFAGYAAGVFLLAIFILMMLLSAGRPVGFNIPAGDDLVSWCMVATSFLGLAHTFRHGEMIRVGLRIDRPHGRPAQWDRLQAETRGRVCEGESGRWVGGGRRGGRRGRRRCATSGPGRCRGWCSRTAAAGCGHQGRNR